MIKDPNIPLYHIRDNIDLILKFTSGGLEELCNDDKTKMAVERCFGIVGEAIAKIAGCDKTKIS